MPLTMRQHEASLHQPAFCELLPIRDYLDNVIVRSNGALVAGYDLGGINSYCDISARLPTATGRLVFEGALI